MKADEAQPRPYPIATAALTVSWRWVHKWTAVALAIPLLFLTLTGIFLQIRAEVSWIQPPVAKGSARFQPTVPMEKVLEAAKSVPQMQVSSWSDIQMLDLRPRSGIVKIRTWKEMETQIDAKTGAILSVNQRLNDIVSSMHDGSYWGLRMWVGLPVAILAGALMIAGIVLLWRQTVEKIQPLASAERNNRKRWRRESHRVLRRANRLPCGGSLGNITTGCRWSC